MNSDSEPLTQPEIEVGWHWCREFDGLLIGPGMSELHCCYCLVPTHTVYSTAPPPDEIPEAGWSIW